MTGATLAVDVGQTGSRLRITYAEGRSVELAGAGYLARLGAEGSVAAAVTAAVRAAGIGRLDADAVAVGLTGLNGRPARPDLIAAGLAPVVPARRVVAADDAVTAFLGAVGVVPGVVTVAGTGAVSLAADGHGRHAHVDGWGPTLGDDGGGYWIGRAGLAAALRAVDGRGPATALTGALREVADVEVAQLPAALAGDDGVVPRVAGFAKAVVAAAASGDPVAAAIVRLAGRELAASAAVAARRAGLAAPVRAALTGGVATASAELRTAYAAELRRSLAGVVAVPVDGTSAALAGAGALLDPAAAALFPGLVVAADGPAGDPGDGRARPTAVPA